MTAGPAVARAREAWGEALPDWVLQLASECDASSQGKVAGMIAYSAPTVSQVIGNGYKGDLGKIEAAVRGRFLSEVVECPVDGEIRTDRCIANQRRPLVATNQRSVRLWKACRGPCPHSRIGGTRAG